MRGRTGQNLMSNGTTALEFAILAPVIITVVVAVIYMSMTFWAYASMHYAVEAAARCSSVRITVCHDDASTKAYAVSHYYGPGSPKFNPAPMSCGHAVTASLTYSWETPIVSVSVPLSASACFP